MTHLHGAVSNIQDGGDGRFTFTYLAPDIEIDTQESFTVTGIKPDYGELTRTFNYTILKAADKNGTRAETDEDKEPTWDGMADPHQTPEDDGGPNDDIDRPDELDQQNDLDGQDGAGSEEGAHDDHSRDAVMVTAGSILVIAFIVIVTVHRKPGK